MPFRKHPSSPSGVLRNLKAFKVIVLLTQWEWADPMNLCELHRKRVKWVCRAALAVVEATKTDTVCKRKKQ